MEKTLFSVLVFFISISAFSNTYYSASSASVNVAASWKDASNVSPSSFNGLNDTYIIKSGFTMTTTARWSIGIATDTTNRCVLQIQSGGILNATSLISVPVFNVDNGGSYIHNAASLTATNNTNDFPGYGTGSITNPLVGRTLGPTSTVEIQKWGNGATTLYNSTESLPTVVWGNFIMNISTLSASWVNARNPFTVKGNFTCIATGGGSNAFKFGTQTAVTVGGNFLMQGGKISLTDEGGVSYTGNFSLTIAGNYLQTGGSFTLADQATGASNHVFNVGGNTTISGGFFSGSGFTTGAYTDPTLITNISNVLSFAGAPSSVPVANGWGIGGVGITNPQYGTIITNITGSTYTISPQCTFSETANATLFAGPLVTGCTITRLSAIVSVPDASVFKVGMRVAGSYIPYGTTVTIIGTGQITLSTSVTGTRASATLVPEYVKMTGKTAGYDNTNWNMNIAGNFTVGSGGTFSWVNADRNISAVSMVVGGDFFVDPAAIFIDPPNWSAGFGGATVYFKGGAANANLTVPAGMADSNIAWIVAPSKTLSLQSNVKVTKFISVGGTLNLGSKAIIGSIPIILANESAYAFNARLYANNDAKISVIPATGVLELGMEVTNSGGYLAPNTVITQVIAGTYYTVAISPAAINGITPVSSTPFNLGIAVGTQLPVVSCP